MLLSSMEKKQVRGAGCRGKWLARENLTEKMTFETKFGDEGASQQIPEERELGKERASSRNLHVPGTANNKLMCLKMSEQT